MYIGAETNGNFYNSNYYNWFLRKYLIYCPKPYILKMTEFPWQNRKIFSKLNTLYYVKTILLVHNSATII